MTKRLIILLILLVVLLVIFYGNFLFINKVKTIIMGEEQQLSENEVLFIGVISEIDLGCWVDASCSMVIDKKKVVWSEGMVEKPSGVAGNLIGFEFKDVSDKNNYIGKNAQVYAKKDSGGNISLYGSKDYYIKLLEK